MQLRTFLLSFCLSVVAAGCDHRPSIQIVSTGDAPAPPSDLAFSVLPSRREVRSTLEAIHRYHTTRSVEVLGDADGKVEWPAQARAWKYQPHTRVVADASNLKFPDAEQLLQDALRFQYVGGKWQPGLEFGLLGFGSVPTDIAFEQPPVFERDADGFALPVIDVLWRGQVLIIDDGTQQLHTAAVTLRSKILCEVRDQRWRALPEVQLVEKRILRSEGASRERLNELRWKMDRWWRNPR